MKITKIYTPEETISKLSPQELEIGKKVLTTNMGLKQDESLLIVTDPDMEKEANIWFEAGKTISPHTQMVVFEGMTENAQEPPAIVSLMMSKSKVLMLQTTFSLTHPKSRLAATKNYARIASLPTVDKDIIDRTLSIDYQPIAKLSINITKILTQSSTARVTSSNGTDITFDIKGRDGIDDTGLYTRPGEYGNLPAGEAFIAPVEGTTNGVYVVDGSFADIEDLDSPLTITVKDGFAIDISDGNSAKKLQQMLDQVGDKNAFNIAELGIGTNQSADPQGALIEAEKAYGTVHIALGNNATIGGNISVPFHSDGVILSPTLTLDKKIILKEGKFKK